MIETNAVIKKVSLFEEYGTLRLIVELEHNDDSTRTFGCYQIGGGHSTDDQFTHKYMLALLRAAGVSDWEKLPGRIIRCRRPNEYAIVEEIGHAVKNDRWFRPKRDCVAEAL